MAVCAICGGPIEQDSPPLPEPAEPPDFDSRPGEPLRSTIGSWVNQCPHCLYAADDITSAQERVPEIVASEAYQSIFEDARVPAKGRQFLGYSFILEKVRQFADAGWSALHAAWLCDDAGDLDASANYRARAIDLWQRGKSLGQMFGDDLVSEFALVTDIYRRLSEWEQATVACAEGLDIEDVPPPVEAMLRRQMVLIHARDSNCHSMKELLEAVPHAEEG